jgi:hypothetical protein
MKRDPIKGMSCEAIDTKPIDYTWDGKTCDLDETGEGWTFWEATRCETCKAIIVGRGNVGGEKHRHCAGASDDTEDDACTCDGYVSETEGPMMSYFYPLAIDDAEEAARKLVDLPVCVVSVDGKHGLALTGGGMDLSWEICEAHMLLGCLPPVHFADLPGIVGRGTSARDRWIVAGCLKACAVSARWAKDRASRIRAMVDRARKDADGKRKGGHAA